MLKKFLSGTGLSYSLIIIYGLAIWWPTKNLPYHWDSAGYVINATRELAERNFWPWVTEFSDFAHPPLFMTLLGIAWKIFGERQIVSHILMLPFVIIQLIGVFEITNSLLAGYKLRKAGAFAAAMIMGTIPVFVAESGQPYLDLPAGAMAIWAIALGMKGYWKGYALALTVGALIKETALLATVPGLYLAWQERKLSDWQSWIKSTGAWVLLPVIAWEGWIIYHWQVTGWWIYRPGRESPPVNLSNSIKFIVGNIFIDQGRWLLSLIALGALISNLLTEGETAKFKWPLVWYVTCSIVGFALTGEFAMRYGLGLLAIWSCLTISELWIWINRRVKIWPWIGAVMVGMICFFQMRYWHPHLELTENFEFTPSADLGYLDMIRIGAESARFVEKNYPDATVYGNFPEIYQLTQPYQGYAHKEINFQMCDKFKLDSTQTQLIYGHLYSPGQIECIKILQTYPVILAKKFESNGKWLDLYEVVRENPGGKSP